MRALLVVAVAVVAVSCGADDDALSPSASSAGAREVGRPRMRDASYDPVVPFESLGDWVSYGDLVVVATVTGEVPADPTDELGAMGWPDGQSIVIDERVWQHPSARRVGTAGRSRSDHDKPPTPRRRAATGYQPSSS
jgi:hypothetical protein